MEDILATKAGMGEKKLLRWTSEAKLKSLVNASRDPVGKYQECHLEKIYESSISALQASASRVINSSCVVV